MSRRGIYFSSICVCCLMLAIPCTAAELSVTTSRQQVELGKSITVIIKASGINKSLTNIDTSALASDFVIKEKGDVDINQQNNVHTLSLRLYPRTTGEKIIPALSFSGLKSTPVLLTVTPAIDPKTKKPIQLEFEYDKREIWVKQQWLLKAKLYLDEKYIVLEAPEKKLNGFNIIPIKSKRFDSGVKGNIYFETGWAIFPSRIGEHTIQLPALKYYRDGVNTHRFYPPVVKLNINPLPSYVPGTMPVGKLHLAVREKQTGLLITNKLGERVVTIKGEGIGLVDLPVYRPKASGSHSIVYYPASGDSRQETGPDGVTSIVNYTVPFVVPKTGVSSFPQIRLHYFDPETGKIQSTIYRKRSFLALNYWLATIVALIGAAIIVWLVKKIYQFIRKYWNFMSAYIRALQTIRRSKNHAELKMALQTLAAAEGWSSNMTLLQLKTNFARKFPELRLYMAGFDGLMQHLYRGDETGFNEIKADMDNLCQARLPTSRLPIPGYFIK